MVTYKYQAVTKEGLNVAGTITATDEFNAVNKVKAKYPILVSLEPYSESFMDKLSAIEIGGGLDVKALSVMCSQFSIILESGVPVDQCLGMVASQTKDKKLRRMLELSEENVSQGTPMATAFQKNYPELPVTFIETVRAGEESGTITDSFATLKEYFERSGELAAKVKSAMSYPMFVLGVAGVVLVVIMAFVMPKFLEMFSSMGGDLPGLTKILVAMTDFFKGYWWLIAAIAVGIGAAFKAWTSTKEGKLTWARIMLKAPLIGNMNTLQGATEFAQTMTTLLGAGMTVTDALGITAKVVSNEQLKVVLQDMCEKTKTGQELGVAMRKSEYFPQVLKEMTAVGEKTGELEKTLDTISKYYNNEYNASVSQVISKIEPLMTIFLAIFAGFIVLALYMPMFGMYDLMGQ